MTSRRGGGGERDPEPSLVATDAAFLAGGVGDFPAFAEPARFLYPANVIRGATGYIAGIEADYGAAQERLIAFARHGCCDLSDDAERGVLSELLASGRRGAADDPMDADCDMLWKALFMAVDEAPRSPGLMLRHFHAMTRIANELRRRLIADRRAALPSYRRGGPVDA
jgi:hypothetical protein